MGSMANPVERPYANDTSSPPTFWRTKQKPACPSARWQSRGHNVQRIRPSGSVFQYRPTCTEEDLTPWHIASKHRERGDADGAQVLPLVAYGEPLGRAIAVGTERRAEAVGHLARADEQERAAERRPCVPQVELRRPVDG